MNDDYKDEYLPRLQRSSIYTKLREKCKDKDTEVISLVDSAVSYAIQRTKTIVRHMGEFTLHDGDHLFRVLILMEKIIPESTIDDLSSPESMLLILSAFFHDIGMSPDEEEVLTWKKIWDTSPDLRENEHHEYNKFFRFYSSRPKDQEIINRLVSQGKNSQADTIKSYLITEFIRQNHAERARLIIQKDWEGKIVFRDTDLTVEFAQICYSHNSDPLDLLQFESNYLCGENIFARLPLIGVLLRLSDILDFDAKRTPKILLSHLYVRNPVSIREWNKHRAVEAWEISPESIMFNAKCTHPAIEASIHEFCDLIDTELSLCNIVIGEINNQSLNPEKTQLRFPYKINRSKITTKKIFKTNPYTYIEILILTSVNGKLLIY